MSVLSAHGLSVIVPAGWDGRIYRRTAGSVPPAPTSPGAAATTTGAAPQSPVVLQVANVAIPAGSGDFAGGAVEQIGRGGIVVVLFEYPGSAGMALFRPHGVPRNLGPGDFDPASLQRAIAGHVGVQRFFTEAGRAFALYAVLGDQPDRAALVATVNSVLSTVVVQPA